MSTKGRFSIVKAKLIDLIKASDSSLNDSDSIVHVFGDWRLATQYFRNLPIVTVRFSPVTFFDMYGRRISDTTIKAGCMATIAWSAHVFAANATSGEKGKPAQDLADKIIDYLKTHRKDTTTGLEDIFGITQRESEPKSGARRMSRIIIEGFLLASRPD